MNDGLLIEVRGLKRHYDGGLVKALDGVDFAVHRGEFIAIMGPSGSGKSTLLHLLGALDRPTEGQVILDGEDLSRAADLDSVRARKVGFVFQLHNLLPDLTLTENVMLPMVSIPGSNSARRRQAVALLEKVGLGPRAHHLPVKVSGGERQRAAIARALANDPPLLLADEPTGSVDTVTGDQIVALLEGLRRERGATIVLITHNEELARRADRIVRIRDGRVERIEERRAALTPLRAGN